MKKMIAGILATGLMMSILFVPALASDSAPLPQMPENTAVAVVEQDEVLCIKCGKQMHTDFEKKPAYYSEWGVIDTFVCNHRNGGMYTIDELLQRLVVKTYFCDDCGTKQIVATHEYKDRCNYKK